MQPLSSVLISKSSRNPDFSTPSLIVASTKAEALKKLSQLELGLFDWQEESLRENSLGTFEVQSGKLGVFVLKKAAGKNQQLGFYEKNSEALCRDLFGEWMTFISSSDFNLSISKKIKDSEVESLAIGLSLSNYSFKSKRKIMINLESDKKKAFERGLSYGDSINFSRWLVDSPPNLLGPEAYKNIIVDHFKKETKFDVKVISRAQLKKEGYGLISAVGQGSETGPFLVHVSYKGKASKKDSIAFVGKGITFDTGGLDIKPSKFMRWMKKDMGGSASVFGIADWVKNNKPKQNFDFIFCIAENSVSKEAVRPSDLMKAKNGLTIEMHNTDAEGRLAMASGLNYLSTLKKKFNYVIDIATLTGAIKVGLGDKISGLFSNDIKMANALHQAGEKAHDPLWPMPMPYWTKKSLATSHIADYVNAKDGYGGAITAAEFLKLFVPENTKWAHLDIYAWTDNKRDSYMSKGATGQSVQAVCEWIKSL